MPLLNQIIAYSQWQNLCKNSETYQYGRNMDAKKAFGRTVYSEYKDHHSWLYGIEYSYRSKRLFDAKTNELILFKPHFNYSASGFGFHGSSGDKTALLLENCGSSTFLEDGENLEKKLQLNEVDIFKQKDNKIRLNKIQENTNFLVGFNEMKPNNRFTIILDFV